MAHIFTSIKELLSPTPAHLRPVAAKRVSWDKYDFEFDKDTMMHITIEEWPESEPMGSYRVGVIVTNLNIERTKHGHAGPPFYDITAK